MDKELIDRAWACLPREFKEKVKKEYYDCKHCNADACAIELEVVFGEHNLTSDAEGEAEMLHVSRKKIQEVYRQNKEEINRDNVSSSDRDCYETVNEVLKTLFGSKCLPDEACNIASNVASSEPKPAEPKFNVGDKIRIVKGGVFYGRIGDVTDIDFTGSIVYYKTDRSCEWLKESDLEPCIEPKENQNPSNSTGLKTQDVDKHFDNILKDGFRNERRLNIAAMAMQGILAYGELVDPDEVTGMAIIYAEKLIEEAEKGVEDEN